MVQSKKINFSLSGKTITISEGTKHLEKFVPFKIVTSDRAVKKKKQTNKFYSRILCQLVRKLTNKSNQNFGSLNAGIHFCDAVGQCVSDRLSQTSQLPEVKGKTRTRGLADFKAFMLGYKQVLCLWKAMNISVLPKYILI